MPTSHGHSYQQNICVTNIATITLLSKHACKLRDEIWTRNWIKIDVYKRNFTLTFQMLLHCPGGLCGTFAKYRAFLYIFFFFQFSWIHNVEKRWTANHRQVLQHFICFVTMVCHGTDKWLQLDSRSSFLNICNLWYGANKTHFPQFAGNVANLWYLFVNYFLYHRTIQLNIVLYVSNHTLAFELTNWH